MEDAMVLTGLILGAIGALFLIVGAVTAIRTRRFLSRSVAAQGTVVGFAKQTSNEGGSSTHAQVEFSTAAGESVTFTERSQTFGGLAKGAAVPVTYDPARPRNARISTSGRLWVSTIITIGLGVALVVVGVILVLVGD
jgi:hypothetical protein